MDQLTYKYLSNIYKHKTITSIFISINMDYVNTKKPALNLVMLLPAIIYGTKISNLKKNYIVVNKISRVYFVIKNTNTSDMLLSKTKTAIH